MTLRTAYAAALTGAAVMLSPAHADRIKLGLPLDCELGDDCYIQQYMDHDPGPGYTDFRCAPLSYDTHGGTDFAVPTLEDMAEGIDVIASAPGVVRGLRDGMADQYYTDENAASLNGRDCGNGVAITHDGGWETQYCHLANGSVSVTQGQRVARGDVLGQIGLSGRTQFPHVHLTVRKDGDRVDPFDPDGQITCGAPSSDTLWIDPPAYQPGGLLDVGFSDRVPTYDDVKSGAANETSLPTDAPALVIYGFAFGGQTGDVLHLTLTGPDGAQIAHHRAAVERDQAQFFNAAGRRLSGAAWASGKYTGTVRLLRDESIISTMTATLTVN